MAECCDKWGISYGREKIFINFDRAIIVDFLLTTVSGTQIAIECDGNSHKLQSGYDRGRDKWLEEKHGIKTIRIRNETILRDPEKTRAIIEREVCLT